MDTTNRSFQVLTRHKIPFITDLLFKCNLVCAVILLIVFLFFLPAESAQTEINIGSYKWLVPSFVKKVLLVALIGLVISFFLWLRLRVYKNAVLSFLPESISINGKNILYTLPLSRITKVTAHNALFIIELPSEKIWVKLKDDNELDAFTNELGKNAPINVGGHNSSLSPG